MPPIAANCSPTAQRSQSGVVRQLRTRAGRAGRAAGRGVAAGASVVIFTANYGEAGAVDRYGPAVGLPPAYSGHNAYGLWGPPPDGGAPVIAVGLPPSVLAAYFRDCAPAERIDNSAGIDNDERGRTISVCAGPRGSWAAIWPALRHLS